MRNMFQLLGGVAVAGVVAAGSSAFTASGLTENISGNSVVGGKVSQTVEGAIMTAASFTVDSANGNEDQVTGAVITLTAASGGAIPAGSVVKATFTGTAVGSPAAFVTCTVGSGSTWDCPIAGAPTKHYTDVTALNVSVVTP